MTAIPKGWQLVPIELTQEMIKAGGYANSEWLNDNAPIGESLYALPMASVWKHILAAAPQPPVAQPLSDKTICDMRYRGWLHIDSDELISFARSVEQAHGIQALKEFHSEIPSAQPTTEFWNKEIAPVLNQALNSVCRKCGGEIRPGKYTEQTYRGSPDFPGQTGNEAGCTINPGGSGKLSDCSAKCTKCGWSVM